LKQNTRRLPATGILLLVGDGLGNGIEKCFEPAFFLTEPEDVAIAVLGRVTRADFEFGGPWIDYYFDRF
jgi:hypothetical protein